MNCIVAVDSNWGIGLKKQLLVRIPADMRFFKATTTGKVVIMGRATLESFPGGKPLADRVNIVVTHDPGYKVPDAIVVHSIEEAAKLAAEYASEDVYIIGGGSIYKQFLPYCDVAYVTKIDFAYDADTFFPNLDNDPEWECVEEGEEQTYYDIIYHFTRYERKKVCDMK